MKRIAISMGNRVFSDSVYLMLKRTGDFRPFVIPALPPGNIVQDCKNADAEILLMDVTPNMPQLDLAGRLKIITEMHKEMPGCKIVLLCDEVAYPELARDVMRTKQVGQIDGFFYASVTGDYLTAALDAL